MHPPSTSQTATRGAIAPYPRDDSRPLAVLTPDADPAGIAERRRVWAPYLTGAAQAEAPLATQFVPLLIDADSDDEPDVAWPATLYPAGFRNQVLGHCAIEPATSWVAEGRRPGGVVHRVCRHLPADIGDSAARDRLGLALTFNTLSLYRATVQVLGRYARSVQTEPHLTYEVARAAYQIGSTGPALQAFAALAGAGCPSLPIRLNAASRLVAHHARSGRDLEACGHWVEVSTTIPTGEAADTDFATGLAVSRVHRAAALHAARRRDAAAVTATLQAADAADRAAEPLAHGPLHRLALRQNRRLLLEAALKAYVASGGRVDALGAQRSADRLANLDPWDPYTRLTVGDARWVLGDDAGALASYELAARMGTLVGAHAAHRGAVVLSRTGRGGEATAWLARARALDPAAPLEESSGA
jgi:hypothetical protein